MSEHPKLDIDVEKRLDNLANKLREAVDASPLEEGWPGLGCKAVTGEVFDTLTSYGLKKEGCVDFLYSSPEEAADAYIKELSDYVVGKRGLIYWRAMPRLIIHEDFDCGLVKGYSVYSRILISDKPMVTYKEAFGGKG